MIPSPSPFPIFFLVPNILVQCTIRHLAFITHSAMQTIITRPNPKEDCGYTTEGIRELAQWQGYNIDCIRRCKNTYYDPIGIIGYDFDLYRNMDTYSTVLMTSYLYMDISKRNTQAIVGSLKQFGRDFTRLYSLAAVQWEKEDLDGALYVLDLVKKHGCGLLPDEAAILMLGTSDEVKKALGDLVNDQ